MILQSAAAAVSASGDTAIITGVSGKRILVYSLVLTYHTGTAPILTIKDGSSTALTGAMDFPAVAGQGLTFALVNPSDTAPWFTCSQGNSFILNFAAAANVNGYVQYAIV